MNNNQKADRYGEHTARRWSDHRREQERKPYQDHAGGNEKKNIKMAMSDAYASTGHARAAAEVHHTVRRRLLENRRNAPGLTAQRNFGITSWPKRRIESMIAVCAR